ncbi:hypothetical protein COO60DRAFT_1660578 [Scenedesmus sp. NREL 46B-D3]|nr:hypothetical protein COO60DRAFT_1660578 [Scenedesmus sp. NREL 46B-D3]
MQQLKGVQLLVAWIVAWVVAAAAVIATTAVLRKTAVVAAVQVIKLAALMVPHQHRIGAALVKAVSVHQHHGQLQAADSSSSSSSSTASAAVSSQQPAAASQAAAADQQQQPAASSSSSDSLQFYKQLATWYSEPFVSVALAGLDGVFTSTMGSTSRGVEVHMKFIGYTEPVSVVFGCGTADEVEVRLDDGFLVLANPAVESMYTCVLGRACLDKVSGCVVPYLQTFLYIARLRQGITTVATMPVRIGRLAQPGGAASPAAVAAELPCSPVVPLQVKPCAASTCVAKLMSGPCDLLLPKPPYREDSTVYYRVGRVHRSPGPSCDNAGRKLWLRVWHLNFWLRRPQLNFWTRARDIKLRMTRTQAGNEHSKPKAVEIAFVLVLLAAFSATSTYAMRLQAHSQSLGYNPLSATPNLCPTPPPFRVGQVLAWNVTSQLGEAPYPAASGQQEPTPPTPASPPSAVIDAFSLPQDIRQLDTKALIAAGVAVPKHPWLVVVGWPCQDLSAAGAGAGLRGEETS